MDILKEIYLLKRWNATVGETVKDCTTPAKRFIRRQFEENRETIAQLQLALTSHVRRINSY